MTFETQNPVFGFFGTMGCTGQDAHTAWAIAFPLIKAATAASAEGVRTFLDSSHGRHFADEVASQMARGLTLDTAIRAAIDVHQGWRIGSSQYRTHGIPAGLPYLTGWVGYYEILDEV